MEPAYVPHCTYRAPQGLDAEDMQHVARKMRQLVSESMQIPAHALKMQRSSKSATVVSRPDLFYRRALKRRRGLARSGCSCCGDLPGEREDLTHELYTCSLCEASGLCVRCAVASDLSYRAVPHRECPRCAGSARSLFAHGSLSWQTYAWIQNVRTLYAYCASVERSKHGPPV